MNLNLQQQQEIARYVSDITAYRETDQEVRDHVLMALADLEDQPFSMELVYEIIKQDFGGGDKIAEAEVVHRDQMINRHLRVLAREMARTFRFPAVWGNLSVALLCVILYLGNAHPEASLEIIGTALIIAMQFPLLLYIFKVFMMERKHKKSSIRNEVLWKHAATSYFSLAPILWLFLTKDSLIPLAPNAQYLLLLVLYFVSSIYLRAFFKIYSRSFKLTVRQPA